MQFECPLAAKTGRFCAFSGIGRGRVVANGAPKDTLSEYTHYGRGGGLGVNFGLFHECLLSRDEGWKEWIGSCTVTRHFLRYQMASSKVIIDNPTITTLR